MTLLSEPLVVFGPRRGDAMTARADALVALEQLVGARAKHRPSVKSSDLEVVASPGGHSAWAFDLVSFAGEPLAVTAVLTSSNDLWLVSAVAVAHTPAMRAVRSELKQQAVVPPGMAALAKLDPAARAAADKLTRGLAAQQVWGDDLASSSDAIVIGPAAGDVTRGKAELKRMWKKRMKANVREALAGELTAEVTPDGQLAWVTAPVVRFADGEGPLPLRVFAVFRKAGDDWRMMALHEALAFDVPGAGAALAKVAPPALPKPAEPAKPAAAAKPTKKKPKHKHTH